MADSSIAIGVWDWSPPCRVPVAETFTAPLEERSVERTYVVDVTADPVGDGFVVAFDDVMVGSDLSEVEAGILLLEAGAFLPSIRVDARGSFVEFVDPNEVGAAIADLAGVPLSDVVVDAVVAAPETQEAVRFNTVDSWYGYWSGLSAVPQPPAPATVERGQRHVNFTPYATEITVTGSPLPPPRPGVPGPPLGSVELERLEDASESLYEVLEGADLSGLDQLASVRETTSVRTVLDPGNLRPTRVNRSTSMIFEGLDGGSMFTQELSVSTFDWDAAQGCGGG